MCSTPCFSPHLHGGSLATPPPVDLLLTSWRHCMLLHSVDFLFLSSRTTRAPTPPNSWWYYVLFHSVFRSGTHCWCLHSTLLPTRSPPAPPLPPAPPRTLCREPYGGGELESMVNIIRGGTLREKVEHGGGGK